MLAFSFFVEQAADEDHESRHEKSNCSDKDLLFLAEFLCLGIRRGWFGASAAT
jgi:hypothetical protein